MSTDGWQSGLMRTPGKRVCRKATRVRIPAHPPVRLTTAQNLDGLTHLQNAVPGQNSPEICPWINDAVAPNDRTRVDDRVAADLGTIPHDRTELAQAGGDHAVGREDRDLGVIEFHVG